MKLTFIWFTLVVLLIAGMGCEQQVKQKKTNPLFKTGRVALQNAEYKNSIEALNEYLKEKPSGRLASRASFLIAKAHMGLDELDIAKAQFEKTIQTYGESDEAHKSQYKLAMISLLSGDQEAAKKQFQKLVDSPSGTLTPEATAMLKYLSKEDGE